MKRRLEMLLGVLLASVLALGGCVAQTDDSDDDDDVSDGQVHSALVTDAVASGTRTTSGTDQGTSSSLVIAAPHVMSDPQPQPWVPPPAPADTSASTPGTPQQH